jgi:hypothetical protein
MNFLFCNRCNKKSEDNILNFNSTEILLKSNKPNLMSNSVKKIESIDEFQNYGEKIFTSLNNLNNIEKEKEELEIIEYPYTKKEIPSKIKPKQFKNNKSVFDAPDLIEQNILNQLNHFGNPKKKLTNKKNEIKLLSKKKVTNIRTNSNNFEHKDTMTDPANLALSSLIKDINRKISPKNEPINIEKIEKEEDIITINDEIEEKIVSLKNKNSNNNNKSEKKIMPKKEINNNKKIIKKENTKNQKKNMIKKNKKSFNNVNNNKIYENLISKISQKKIKNRKVSEYNNNIMKKKNILKNKSIFTNNTNLGINSLCLSTKKQFPKSYSFNCFNSERKNNGNEISKKESNTKNTKNELGYSWTIQKKNINLKANERILSSKNKNENINKCKITHKKISRGQIPIQKTCSSHISS